MARTNATAETDEDSSVQSLDTSIDPVGPEDDGEDSLPPEAEEEA